MLLHNRSSLAEHRFERMIGVLVQLEKPHVFLMLRCIWVNDHAHNGEDVGCSTEIWKDANAGQREHSCPSRRRLEFGQYFDVAARDVRLEFRNKVNTPFFQ